MAPKAYLSVTEMFRSLSRGERLSQVTPERRIRGLIMISAIVYGRNDAYSYELNQRTALGLNQLACQLDPDCDEIVFVDYNTDDDLPTHPEAIADTLTPRAVELIHVIRVRPDVHADLPSDGPPVREAFCRNIALRRVKSGAKWVLSTNPDCLLLSAGGAPLAQLAETLPDGYFGLPRFELPRFVWEALPRNDPDRAADMAMTFAKAFGLEEEVRHYLPAIGYDGPGDFQLASVEAMTALCGFDERMAQGWHIDSNMNARLALRFGQLQNFNEATGGALKLFHTEHARRFSAKHGADRAEDPFETYVEAVTDEVPAHQATTWGAPDVNFERFPLSAPPARQMLTNLVATAKGGVSASYVYGPDSFDDLPRGEDHEDHLFVFLFDHFAYAPPNGAIGWFGDDAAMADRFVARVGKVGLTNPIHAATGLDGVDATLKAAEILVIDAGPNRESDQSPVGEAAFAGAIRQEWARGDAKPRRIIGLNVPHSRFEAPFLTLVPSVMTPVATHIRFGEAAPRPDGPIDLMPDFKPGEAGKMISDVKIDAVPGQEGYVALYRRAHLPPGRWRLEYTVSLGLAWKGRAVIDVALNGESAGANELPVGRPGRVTGAIEFESGANGLFGGGVECRLWADGRTRVSVTSARLVLLGDREIPAETSY